MVVVVVLAGGVVVVVLPVKVVVVLVVVSQGFSWQGPVRLRGGQCRPLCVMLRVAT